MRSINKRMTSLFICAVLLTFSPLHPQKRRGDNKQPVSEVNAAKPRTIDEIKDIWYDGRDGSNYHYHDSRYHLLNLHSVFSKGTVEFRAFNSTLHAGVIRSYLVFRWASARRCPTAKVLESKMLQGHELEFRGVATIVPKKGAEVPVLIWEIGESDEIALDRYEGFPSFYRKEIFEMEVGGKVRDART